MNEPLTAPEKADELVNTFYGELYPLTELRPRIARQCALIHVDGVIEVLQEIPDVYSTWHFWREVRKEIIKMK